jgi:hypothetical protein
MFDMIPERARMDVIFLIKIYFISVLILWVCKLFP